MYWNNVDVVSSYYIRWTLPNITTEEQLHMWNAYIIYAQIKKQNNNTQWNKYLDTLVGKYCSIHDEAIFIIHFYSSFCWVSLRNVIASSSMNYVPLFTIVISHIILSLEALY